MRFGRGGPSDFADPDYSSLDDDDAYWEATRGRRDVRRSHDPLVTRIKELRVRSKTDVRHQIDALKYGRTGRRCERLQRRRRQGYTLTPEQESEVADYEAQLAVLYAELDRGRTT